ncbi:MAG: HNH endonuclease signature motif containing protein [bacterium]|nr:HNH endonuclease signature motif containing protein [bacterium]
MYGYLLDFADDDTAQPAEADSVPTDGAPRDLFMSGYQKQRQRVYDRADHMLNSRGYAHSEVECAKAEAGLVRGEAQISRARGEQLGWLKAMLRHHGPARYGYRNPIDLVVSRLDVRRDHARELVYLAQRLDDGTIGSMRQGEASYVRVLEETRLREAGASPEDIARARDLGLDEIGRLRQQYQRMTRADEKRVFDSQYVAFQPSLDGTHVKMNGRLGAMEAEICRQGLDRRGERVVPAGADRPDAGQRRALALTTLCQDELDRKPTRPATTAEKIREARSRREPVLMVVAQTPLAEDSGYEQGTGMLAGGRVGPGTIDLIECAGRIETIAVDGQDIIRHRSRSGIPLALRRAVLARDDGCTIDACASAYRLEVHHIIPRSQGGDHRPENLTTLCWWHHHVAVHRQGMRIDSESPPRRRQLLPTPNSCGYQPPEPDTYTLAILRALHTATNRAPP